MKGLLNHNSSSQRRSYWLRLMSLNCNWRSKLFMSKPEGFTGVQREQEFKIHEPGTGEQESKIHEQASKI